MHRAPLQTSGGLTLTVTASDSGEFGRLAQIIDFKGEDFPGQTNNRTLVFHFDSEGNLVRASLPVVSGTPTGNDRQPTSRYKYIVEDNLPILAPGWGNLSNEDQDKVRERLLHKLTHIWYPNEVKNNVSSNPPDAEAREVITYETDPNQLFFGFPKSYTIGVTNTVSSGLNYIVPSGGTITYTWTDRNPGRKMLKGVQRDPTILINLRSLLVRVTDRAGNQSAYLYGGAKKLLGYREFTRGFRNVEPEFYQVTYEYNKDRLMTRRQEPEGNFRTSTYNQNSPDRHQQSNKTGTIRIPDARGGEQNKIERRQVFETAYNRACLIISARGADVANNDFTPPIPDPAAGIRLVPDPYDPSKIINLRYARVEYFEYQESTEKAANAPNSRLDIDGSGGRVNRSPLFELDPNVLTTEVWLVQELGLPENVEGLAILRSRLSSNLTKLGLGDLNGDGDTTPAISGDIVRTVWGSPVLIAGSNQDALETKIETDGDLINEDIGLHRWWHPRRLLWHLSVDHRLDGPVQPTRPTYKRDLAGRQCHHLRVFS